MTEEPVFIRRRISHYGAMSKLDLNDENRANVVRLLAEAERELEVATNRDVKRFPVVCVGGSAGGLDAYTRLLQGLPSDMGVAIVIVNHLRIVATQLHEILPRFTTMPVELITEGLVLQPDHVFIIPSHRDLHVFDGEFRLKAISKPRGWPDVITVFLRSLTQHWDGKIIAVIVSGYDGDGAAALCGIKEVGGITLAQKPETAGQPDMPESAIESGFIDFILSPEDIARKISQIAERQGVLTTRPVPAPTEPDQPRSSD
jgi:two-component system, chemotaxis family, protein-glutamate methylesterase/glutaminase